MNPMRFFLDSGGSMSLFDGGKDHLEAPVVRGQLALELSEFDGELSLVRCNTVQTDEGTNHENADFHRPWRVQYRCRHHCPVLGERVGTVLVMLAAL